MAGPHPDDVCGCGDYRSEHPDDGACSVSWGGFDCDCDRFRLTCTDEDMRAGEGEHEAYVNGMMI